MTVYPGRVTRSKEVAIGIYRRFVTLFHGSWRRRVSLLAAGALEGVEAAATRAHADGCAACREELSALDAVLQLVAADPLAQSEPDVPLPVLLARVEARIDARERARAAGSAQPTLAWRWVLRPLPAALAVGLALLALSRPASLPPAPPVPTELTVPDDLLRRLEANLAREQAVRYLNEAQDVLLTMAAKPQDCDRKQGRVDVGQQARRSRELLAGRALLVEIDRDEMAPARPVLEDVERLLREVAALESCARSGEIEAIHRQIQERRLLMKIDLMTRELAG
jgi:hypothetical protein